MWHSLPEHHAITSIFATVFIFFSLAKIISITKMSSANLFMTTGWIYKGIHSCQHIPEFFPSTYNHQLGQCIPATCYWSVLEVGEANLRDMLSHLYIFQAAATTSVSYGTCTYSSENGYYRTLGCFLSPLVKTLPSLFRISAYFSYFSSVVEQYL